MNKAESPVYWRSLEELEQSPEFREMVRRGMPGQTWESLPPATRRNFLKVMGASIAMAGFAGCRWPQERIVPFAKSYGYTPGVPLQFATSMEIGGVAGGLLVTSYDGRPIKIEGNTNHPVNMGASTLREQASVLDLYDPSRSRSVVRREGGRRGVADSDAFAAAALPVLDGVKMRRGAGLRVLAEASASPTLARLRARMATELPEARWYEYESASRDNERSGAVIAFGAPLRTQFDLTHAAVVVSLDSDFLVEHPASVKLSRDFMASRRAESGSMSRLYVVESSFTNTGGVADHRFAVRPSQIPAVASALVAELAARGVPVSAALASGAGQTSFRPAFVSRIADDLAGHRGRSLLLVGPGQDPAVHALAHAVNEALGNVGTTVTYTTVPDPERASTHAESIRALTDEMAAGGVEMLLVLGGNPAYDAPADVRFAEALARVPASVRLGLHEDETSALCAWHLPRAHYLESWGDARAWDGTVGPVQPLIEPLYGGRTPIELIAFVLDGHTTKGHELARDTFRSSFAADAIDPEAAWKQSLHDGVVRGSSWTTVPAAVRPDAVSAAMAGLLGRAGEGGASALEGIFRPDIKVHDGRFANNSWLQECPDPMTKMTWDNAAVMSPATARSLGVGADDIVSVRAGGGAVDLPVYVMPGFAEGTIGLALGYGRSAAGDVGNGVGASVERLRTAEAMHEAPVRIEKTGRRHGLACTQDHHPIDMVGLRAMHQRLGQIVREADLPTFQAHPGFAKEVVEHPELKSPWKEWEYEGHRWGMTIDLGACTGCGACVVACQSENNVPVVGRDEVRRSREMHWLRIDRYFVGPEEDPRVAHQPMMCVHCENAPCEEVCPVNATVHSNEGLNQMVYNRCVGTRYCSNNCPYKVRRFNWFNNFKDLSPVEKMVHNPDVTVRGRGVMEKCTYCVQRIEGAKIRAKNDGRVLQDGDIVTACQQACPTNAIVFGDLANPHAKAFGLHELPRSYGLLAELNTKPRTAYLARITNPAGATAQPAGESHEGHHEG